MPEFFKTTVEIDKVVIDTRITFDDQKRAEPFRPWWLAASAAFIVDSNVGSCVILVQRSGTTDFSGNWALLPAGGAESIEELRHPHLTVEREAREELRIQHYGAWIDPISQSDLLTRNQVEILDRAGGDTYEQGEIHASEKQFIFMRAYKLKLPLEEVWIMDGEEGPGGMLLDRTVAAVRIADDLEGKVTPIRMFKSLESVEPTPIDLSGYQTPTLSWFRSFKRRNKFWMS